jgi:hypothetical protein
MTNELGNGNIECPNEMERRWVSPTLGLQRQIENQNLSLICAKSVRSWATPAFVYSIVLVYSMLVSPVRADSQQNCAQQNTYALSPLTVCSLDGSEIRVGELIERISQRPQSILSDSLGQIIAQPSFEYPLISDLIKSCPFSSSDEWNNTYGPFPEMTDVFHSKHRSFELRLCFRIAKAATKIAEITPMAQDVSESSIVNLAEKCNFSTDGTYQRFVVAALVFGLDKLTTSKNFPCKPNARRIEQDFLMEAFFHEAVEYSIFIFNVFGGDQTKVDLYEKYREGVFLKRDDYYESILGLP